MRNWYLEIDKMNFISIQRFLRDVLFLLLVLFSFQSQGQHNNLVINGSFEEYDVDSLVPHNGSVEYLTGWHGPSIDFYGGKKNIGSFYMTFPYSPKFKASNENGKNNHGNCCSE